LGDTIEAIAKEKSGIIKTRVPVVSAVKDSKAVAVIENKARIEQAPIYQLYKDFMIGNVTQEGNQQSFSYQLNGEMLTDLHLKMMGHHQVENASLAITTVHLLNKINGFTISEDSIRNGLLKSSWAARFEEILPNVIIDGAHNPAGMKVLLQTIEHRYPSKNVHVVFTALQDKDIASILHMLDEISTSITVTEIDVKNAAIGKKIFDATNHPQKQLIIAWQDALENTLAKLDDSSVVLITGSLYFMSLVRPYLLLKVQAKVV
jgi:dihydrofolate synthase/folylpolyglutamate synthase